MPRQRSTVVGAEGTAALEPRVVLGADTSGSLGTAAAGSERTLSSWVRVWGLHTEVMLTFVAGVAAAFASSTKPYVALLALGAWMLGTFHEGRAVTTPLTRQFRILVGSALLPLAVLSAGVGYLGVAPASVPQAFAALSAAAGMSLAIRTFRWKLQAPVRVVVVGDRSAVATATARWARTSNVHVVGGLVVEDDLAEDAMPHEILGVPTVLGLDRAKALVRLWRADLVVVNPGQGVTTEAFRRLTWALEGSRVSLGVSGVLETVAAHRITPGGLERSGIMSVRSPRPSAFVRGVKAGLDRLAALVLLVLVSPVLLSMVVAVRLDSRGSAFFTQVRVGRGGRHFKVYKMRTMVSDAEAIKAKLAGENEFDSVLFKMKRDPRITRVGQFLRKSSLDELPQLINVLKGDMSLVGPRPFLPDEVARMDEDTLRRHAVQPGITGLWQVSGRSDLAWDESAALDTYYADNWSLTGDLAIGLRTVKAVVGGDGAY